jgi:hypothetical protein
MIGNYDSMKGGLMGEPYLLLKIEETAHLPVLAVRPHF